VRQGFALRSLGRGVVQSVILPIEAKYDWRRTHGDPRGVVQVEVCLRGIVGDCERREISENEIDEQEKREGGSWRHDVGVQGSYCIDLSRILSSL
jgi:hypothetical protein